ncbi:hypothetical protein JCM16303_003671 [Sporobolomyces ruberrimus]
MLLRRLANACPACGPRTTSYAARLASSSTSSRPSSLPHPVIDLTDVLDFPQDVKDNIRQRKYPMNPEEIDKLRSMEIEAIGLRKELQAARERRNLVSKAPPSDLEARKEGSIVKKLLKELEPRLTKLDKSIQLFSLELPNSSHPHVPIGSEDQAKLVKTLGPPVSSSSPPPARPELDHLELSSPSNFAWTDFPSSSLTTGSSWPLLTNEAALLELALTNYSMSIALSHGFKPVLTPDVVRSDVSERCGFKPRDAGQAQQTYFLSDGESTSNLCLAGTAEIPLVAMSGAQTFRQEQLPLKYVALGRAFRAEAGARGADSRGLYRVHQFSKVEMVMVCAEDESDRLLEELRKIQEEILGNLGLSLRVLDMPTEELGASAHRKYDIEAWMPGRGKWGELSSASNCTDYQARRLGIRYRPTVRSPTARAPLETLDLPTPAALEATANYPSRFVGPGGGGAPKLAYAHTLNGTAAAIPRLVVALLENGAVLEEGGKVSRVRLPRVLKPFWIGDHGSKRIESLAINPYLTFPHPPTNDYDVVHSQQPLPQQGHDDSFMVSTSYSVGFHHGPQPLEVDGPVASLNTSSSSPSTLSTTRRRVSEDGSVTPDDLLDFLDSLSPSETRSQTQSVTGLSSTSLSIQPSPTFAFAPLDEPLFPTTVEHSSSSSASSSLGFLFDSISHLEHNNIKHIPSTFATNVKGFDAGDISMPFDLSLPFDTIAYPVLESGIPVYPSSSSSDKPSSTVPLGSGIVDPVAFDQTLDSPLAFSSQGASPWSDLLASPMFSLPNSGSVSETPLPPLDPSSSSSSNTFDFATSSSSSSLPLFGPLPTPSALPYDSSSTTLRPLPPLPLHRPSFDSSTSRQVSASPSPTQSTSSLVLPTPPPLQSAPTPARPEPTGFRTTQPLLGPDAPIQTRNPLLSSSTSRKRKTAGAEKALAKKRLLEQQSEASSMDVEPLNPEELPADIVAQVERKRLQNTMSARKSRARKQMRMQELEEENKGLMEENQRLKAQLELFLGSSTASRA